MITCVVSWEVLILVLEVKVMDFFLNILNYNVSLTDEMVNKFLASSDANTMFLV